LRNLRAALDATGRKFGVSITIVSEEATVASVREAANISQPSSYWYMQHFDIVSIDPIIDWFNIMTYDL